MFFSIGKKKKSNFTTCHKAGDYYICLDDGWTKFSKGQKQIFFKGYVLGQKTKTLISKMEKNPLPKYKGNFCCIIVDAKQITITHDIHRSFPLYLHGDQVTNLKIGKLIGSNVYVTIQKGFVIKKNSYKNYSISNEQIPYAKGLKHIHELLTKTFKTFLKHNKLPIKIFISGGVDTVLAYSYLKRLGAQFDILDTEHKKSTKFFAKNKNLIEKFWAYKQIHNWHEPCVLVTGSCGDEYMMRNPNTVKKFFDFHGIDIANKMKKEYYHYKYFNRPENKKVLTAKKQYFKNIYLAKMELFRNMSNDHQHWHLDNTLYFTPFKDLQLADLILQLPIDQLLQQALDAKITKDLIALNNKRDLDLLSKYKNH